MSYLCTHVQHDSLYTPYVDAMFATLSGAGWELHDDINSIKRAYKSKGENGDYCYGYMLVSLEATYNLELRMYQDWNSVTHAGIAGTYYSVSDARIPLNFHKPVLMYCNKNFLLMWQTNVSPSDACITFGGILSEVLDTTLTTTVSGASSGSTVTLHVLSTDGFFKGARYKLVGTHQEGREVVTVASITNETSLVVESLNCTFESGAYFGKDPCPIYTQYNISSPEFYCGFGYNPAYAVYGTGNNTYSYARYSADIILTAGYLDPDSSYSLYGLAPLQYLEYSGYSYVGYFTDALYAPVAASTPLIYDSMYMNGDLYVLDRSPIYTVVSGTTNMLTLSNVSWGINELQDKIVVIAVGNASGYTRKIISNTSDTIMVGVDWDVTVNGDDSIFVCNAVYRPLSRACYKEVI